MNPHAWSGIYPALTGDHLLFRMAFGEPGSEHPTRFAGPDESFKPLALAAAEGATSERRRPLQTRRRAPGRW